MKNLIDNWLNGGELVVSTKSDSKNAKLMYRALQAIVATLDGRQPKDAPGALMVAQSVLKAVDSGTGHDQFFADASRIANNRIEQP